MSTPSAFSSLVNKSFGKLERRRWREGTNPGIECPLMGFGGAMAM